MKLTASQKEELKKEIVACLAGEPEIEKIVIFGSAARGEEVNDLDIAIFQKSDDPYLPLALSIAKRPGRLPAGFRWIFSRSDPERRTACFCGKLLPAR